MAAIERVEIHYVDLKPKVVRTDAIQSFVSQQTPIVTITDADGATGTGYTYTIGTGGTAVLAHLADDLAPKLIGMDAARVEAIWRTLKYHTHATTPGAMTALALCAIDTALWDLRAKRAGLPLSVMAGGAREKIPLYTTEGGWLHIEPEALVADAVEAMAKGFGGSKVKIGKPDPKEDVARLEKVREAVGGSFEIFTDANQAFRVDEAIRRARLLEPLDIGWLEEPLVSDDIEGHVRLSASTSLPVAVGESIYSTPWFREYMQRGACSVVQADVARIGGITPWLKVAHAAETFNMPICPHFLMELHVSLCCAVPNARWLEYIPQLDTITAEGMAIEAGHGVPSPEPGIGIRWDWDAIAAQRARDTVTVR